MGSALFYVFGIFGTGLMSGLDTLVSQAFGAGKRADGWRSLGSGLLLAALSAGDRVLQLGYADVSNVDGGTAAWIERGYPVER